MRNNPWAILVYRILLRVLRTGVYYLDAVFLIDQTVWSEWSGLIRVSSGLDRLDHLPSGSDGLSYYLNLAQTV